MSEKQPRGQDPEKTTGQERAAEVRQNKPKIEDMPPPEGVEPPTDQEENEAQAEVQPLPADQARDDDTIDDSENDVVQVEPDDPQPEAPGADPGEVRGPEYPDPPVQEEPQEPAASHHDERTAEDE